MLRIFVNKLSYYPDRIQYFKDGGHFKTLTFEDVNDIQREKDKIDAIKEKSQSIRGN